MCNSRVPWGVIRSLALLSQAKVFGRNPGPERCFKPDWNLPFVEVEHPGE